MKRQLVEFGSYSFDLTTHELWCDDQPIRLAPMPSKALAILAAVPNRLVTHTTLRDALWESPPLAWEKSLYFTVLQIRKALDDTRYVETVPRRGYRLLVDQSQNQRTRISTVSSMAFGIVALLVLALAVGWRESAPTGTQTPALIQEGRFLLEQRTADATERAEQRFSNALGVQNHPDAWDGLAESRLRLYLLGKIDVEPLREAASGALTHAPGSAMGHRVSGAIATIVDWDFDTAMHHYQRALELDPIDPMTRLHYSSLLQITGDIPASLVQVDKALAADAPSSLVIGDAAWAYLYAGAAADARILGERALALAPELLVHHELIMLVELADGNREAADRAARDFVSERASEAFRQQLESHRAATATSLFDALRDVPHTGPSAMVSRAVYDAAVGDTVSSLDRLEEGARQRAPFLLLRLRDPRLQILCNEPRFIRLHADIGIPLPLMCSTAEPIAASDYSDATRS